jgi:hypothetical protein
MGASTGPATLRGEPAFELGLDVRTRGADVVLHLGRRLGSHVGAQQRRDARHLGQQRVFVPGGVQQVLHASFVAPPDAGHLEEAGAQPPRGEHRAQRPVDGPEALVLTQRRERRVGAPRHEVELAVDGVAVGKPVVAVVAVAVPLAHQRLGRPERQERIHVHARADAAEHVPLVGALERLLQVREELPVQLLLGLALYPAQVRRREVAELPLEERAIGVLEVEPQEGLVHAVHVREHAQVFAVHAHPRVVAARRGHPGCVHHAVGEARAQVARVLVVVVERHALEPIRAQVLGEAQLERRARAAQRAEEALLADLHVLEAHAVHRDRGREVLVRALAGAQVRERAALVAQLGPVRVGELHVHLQYVVGVEGGVRGVGGAREVAAVGGASGEAERQQREREPVGARGGRSEHRSIFAGCAGLVTCPARADGISGNSSQ